MDSVTRHYARENEKRHNFLTSKEALERLGISMPTLLRWIKAGKIKAAQAVPRGKLMISIASVENCEKGDLK